MILNRAEAIKFVDEYLQANEDRELDKALKFWGDNIIHLQFPGQEPFDSFQGVLDWASARYQWVKKHRDNFYVEDHEGVLTVVSQGRLYGINLHGVPFEDVRYVDIFTIRNDLMEKQLVWNDLETGDWLTRTVAEEE